MEVGKQQEDVAAAAAAGMEMTEQKHEEATARESGEEQGVETGEPQQEDIAGIDALAEKEDAVMESLPMEVETDKLRREREKAPDNAEERAVHEGAGGGLGFPGENTVRVSDGEENREVVVGLDGAGERNGTVHEVHAEGQAEGQAQEDRDAEGEAVAETEVEMVDAAAAIDEGEAEAEERGPAEENRAGTMSILRMFPILHLPI